MRRPLVIFWHFTRLLNPSLQAEPVAEASGPVVQRHFTPFTQDNLDKNGSSIWPSPVPALSMSNAPAPATHVAEASPSNTCVTRRMPYSIKPYTAVSYSLGERASKAARASAQRTQLSPERLTSGSRPWNCHQSAGQVDGTSGPPAAESMGELEALVAQSRKGPTHHVL